MEKEASFIEINDSVVTLKIVNGDRIAEKVFSSRDLQRLGVHETLLKDYYRSMGRPGTKIDPFDLGDF